MEAHIGPPETPWGERLIPESQLRMPLTDSELQTKLDAAEAKLKRKDLAIDAIDVAVRRIQCWARGGCQWDADNGACYLCDGNGKTKGSTERNAKMVADLTGEKL